MKPHRFAWVALGMLLAVLAAAPARAVTGLVSRVDDCNLKVGFAGAASTPAAVRLVVTQASSSFEDSFTTSDLSKVERSYSMQGFDAVTMSAAVTPDRGKRTTVTGAARIGCGAQERATVAGLVFERGDPRAPIDLARTGSMPARLAVLGMLAIALGSLAFVARQVVA